MDGVLSSIAAIIFFVQVISGILGNGFIVLVNCMDWMKRRKISSLDQVLTALAISRIAVLLSLLLDWWVSTFYPLLWMTGTMLKTTHVSWIVSNHFSLWLATSLSIFYFLKIASFSNSLFFSLKWRVPQVVAMTLLMSLLLLFIEMTLSIIHIDVWICELNRNMSFNFSSRIYGEYTRLVLFPNFMFALIPFVISLAIFVLLIFSLWKHLKNMQHMAQGCRNSSTTAHIRALQIITAFLVLYITFFLTIAVEVWTVPMGKRVISLFAKATIVIFPSMHSCVLILGNDKLRQALLWLFWWLRCRFRKETLRVMDHSRNHLGYSSRRK